MKLVAIIFICAGTISFLLGLSNKIKKSSKGEKTSVGQVVAFGFLENYKVFPIKYRAVVKAGAKKYTIDAYSMPWLKKDEDVMLQITGKQKILGNNRLNNRSKIEIFFGIVLIIFPFVLLLS